MATANIDELEDVKPNDLDLLIKNLESVVLEPRHLDVYRKSKNLSKPAEQRNRWVYERIIGNILSMIVYHVVDLVHSVQN